MRIRMAAMLSAWVLGGMTGALRAQEANSAVIPVPRDDWMQAHRSFVATAGKGQAQVVFLGDSITAGWNSAGKEFWAARYSPRQAVNFGIGGDRTENILWRVQNGEFDGIKPRVVVLLIGTNNLKAANTPDQIAEGVAAIAQEIRKRSPDTKILLLGVFPRGDKPDTGYRKPISEINTKIAKLEDGQKVFFLDIGSRFLEPDGSLSPKIMGDFLHPSAEGYKIFSDAIEGKLTELLES